MDSFSITLHTVLYIRVSINITRGPRCSQSQTENGAGTHLCCRDPQQSRCNDENCLHDAPIPVSVPGRWTANTDVPGPVGFIPSACLPVSHLSEDDPVPELSCRQLASSDHTDLPVVTSQRPEPCAQPSKARQVSLLPNSLDCPRRHPMIDSCCTCLLYTSPSPRDDNRSRMPSSA